jgi:hypothetical protein
VKEFRLQKFPNRWGIIMTGVSADGAVVETGFVDTLDEALAWIRERG